MLSFLCEILVMLGMELQAWLLLVTNSVLIFCQCSPAAFLQVPAAARTARGLGRGGVSLKNTQGNGKETNKQSEEEKPVPVTQGRESLGSDVCPRLHPGGLEENTKLNPQITQITHGQHTDNTRITQG